MFNSNTLDFESYCPVKLKTSDAYFVFNVEEHTDFDNASRNDKYSCYPVRQNGEVDLASVFILKKEEIQAIPV